MSIVVACRSCGAEVESHECRDGRCPTCWLRAALRPEFDEYRRLWDKRSKRWVNTTQVEGQITRLVVRLSRRIATALGYGPGSELLNAELATIRDEVERRASSRIVAARAHLVVPASSVLARR